ncbi:MAG: FHA domain-containing protein [Oscillospiraceae bacterium]|nr:FHA domain-containing protein [Oscillospiraceae bacterium]
MIDPTVAVAPSAQVGSYDKTVSIVSDKRIPIHVQVTDDKGRVSDRQLVIEERLEIGRSPECGLVLTDSAVSQRHTLLRAEGGKLTAQDIGSTNGTLLYGQPLKGAASLLSGSVLKLGNTTLTIRY